MHALLRELAGVAPENATLLLGEDAETTRRAVVTVNDRIRQSDPSQAMLIVYYSGHADENALHLGDSTTSSAASVARRTRTAMVTSTSTRPIASPTSGLCGHRAAAPSARNTRRFATR